MNFIDLNAILQFKLADIGEGIAEVSVKEWYVKEGDVVKQFDKICEVQSDKATVTITSRYDGVIKKLYYNVDDTAFVGKPLVDIETKEEANTDSTEAQTDTISDSLERIETLPCSAKQQQQQQQQELFKINKVLATPAVRKLAMENKVNLNEVQGSGKDGRVLKDDIFRYLEQREVEAIKPATPSQGNIVNKIYFEKLFSLFNYIFRILFLVPPVPSKSEHQQKEKKQQIQVPRFTVANSMKQDRQEQIKGMRKVMVKTMTQANSIPHFSYCDEYNMNSLMDSRKHLKEVGKERGVKFSYLPIIIKVI
jgi:2-oxoisovalerate dehydrogenase E2 component (dihydrolipoyl transacylase)